MNKAYKKAIASARYFRNKGEIDMWHCVWHEGKPYDYHLFVDFDYEQNKDICMMVIYKTYKLKDGTYDIDCNDSLYVHQFKNLSKKQSNSQTTKISKNKKTGPTQHSEHECNCILVVLEFDISINL